jgi:hypothetical protein
MSMSKRVMTRPPAALSFVASITIEIAASRPSETALVG